VPISLYVEFIKNFTDTITLSDNILNPASRNRSYSDTLNLSDSVFKSATRTFSDTLNLSDSIAKIKAAVREFTDTISLTDTYSRSLILSKLFTETLTLSDEFSTLYTEITKYPSSLFIRSLLSDNPLLFSLGLEEAILRSLEEDKPSLRSATKE